MNSTENVFVNLYLSDYIPDLYRGKEKLVLKSKNIKFLLFFIMNIRILNLTIRIGTPRFQLNNF